MQDALVQVGIRSKRRVFASGKIYGGCPLSRGQIHFLLTNPIYIGQIRHKKLTWPGQQEAIIEQDLWERVQTKLQAASARPRIRCQLTGTLKQPQARSMLAGKLRDETGDRLTPSHTTRRGRRLRYYVSNRLISARAPKDGSGWRLPAPELEQAVARIVAGHLGTCADRQAILMSPKAASAAELARKARNLVERVRQSDGIYTNCLDFDFYRNGELLASVTVADLLMGIQPRPERFEALESLLRDFIAQRPQTITAPRALAGMTAGSYRPNQCE